MSTPSNNLPHLSHYPANPYGITVDEGKMFDIDEDDMVRWCEYILYRGLYRTSYARLSQGIITDTELQIGQFVLPKYGHKVVDDSHPARYLRSRKEELPETHVSVESQSQIATNMAVVVPTSIL